MKFLSASISISLCTMSSFAQELPIQNGDLEQTSGLIYFTGDDSEIQCSVFSISGKKLFKQTISNGKSLDLSKLKRGIYFVQTQRKESIQNFKVLLNQ